jgi:thioredoxin
MEILNQETFKSKVFDYEKNKEWTFAGDLPVIVDFYADWCGPCRALSPILQEISDEYAGRIHVYKVNTEATPELAGMFGVRGIPALLFIPKSGEPAMSAGLMPKDGLKKAIHELLGVAEG